MKMHDGEIDIDESLVARLLRAQFPQYADLPIREFGSAGTVNAVYRLGDELYVRLPRLAKWAPDLEREARWLPVLAPRLSLRAPEVVAEGEPSAGFGWRWAIYRWLDGQPFDDGLLAAGGEERAAWDGTPAWIHTDLLRPNLLVSDGRLSAVLDFGMVGRGDPAADVVPAWSVFGPAGRKAYRAALDVDEATWQRARGYALHQAAVIIPYYASTNPAFAEQAMRTVAEVIADVRN